jgi:hypothetical protein
MKGFAIFILVISILAFLLGIFALTGNGESDAIQGAAMIGSGIGGVIFSCVLIVLADIRNAVRHIPGVK